MLGNGGSTVFWDVATFGLVERAQPAPRVRRVLLEVRRGLRRRAPPRRADDRRRPIPAPIRSPQAEDGIDLYALTHNETSTGVSMQLRRPAGTTAASALVAVDATSAAGGLEWDPAEVDVYYFAPQKCFASDGGLWLAACSPAAVERIRTIGASDRWRPASLDLSIALDNSTQNQTYNTPALATLVMLDAQLDWMLGNGGLVVGRRTQRHVGGDALRLGRGPRVGDTVRHRSGAAIERRRHDRPRRRDRRQHGVRRAAGERHPRHRLVPQARPQPAAYRHVPGDRSGRRRGADALHRPRRRATRLTLGWQTSIVESDDVLSFDTGEIGVLDRPVMLVGLEGWFDMAGAATQAINAFTNADRAVTVGVDRPRPVLRLHPAATARLDRRRHPRDHLAEQRVHPPAQPGSPRHRRPDRRRAASALEDLRRRRSSTSPRPSDARRSSPSGRPPRRSPTPARRRSPAAPPTPNWRDASAWSPRPTRASPAWSACCRPNSKPAGSRRSHCVSGSRTTSRTPSIRWPQRRSPTISATCSTCRPTPNCQRPDRQLA